MISAGIRPIAIAAIASIALVGAAEAASKGKSKSHVQPAYGHYSQPYYGYPQVHPSGSLNSRNGTYQNFGNLPRDTRNEGFNTRYGLDFGREPRGGR
jgi:hypothetical protein